MFGGTSCLGSTGVASNVVLPLSPFLLHLLDKEQLWLEGSDRSTSQPVPTHAFSRKLLIL